MKCHPCQCCNQRPWHDSNRLCSLLDGDDILLQALLAKPSSWLTFGDICCCMKLFAPLRYRHPLTKRRVTLSTSSFHKFLNKMWKHLTTHDSRRCRWNKERSAHYTSAVYSHQAGISRELLQRYRWCVKLFHSVAMVCDLSPCFKVYP